MISSGFRFLAVGACAVLLGTAVTPVSASSVGEQWYLPIAGTVGGGFTVLPGDGYNGTDAVKMDNTDPLARLYWVLDAPDVDPNPQFYTIEFYDPVSGPVDWQTIQTVVPSPPVWPAPPGATQQLSARGSNSGTFVMAGPGPSAFGPAGAYPPAAGLTTDGTQMLLEQGSPLYAKWDIGWNASHTWSYLRITQVTPEPGGLLALGAGLVSMGGWKRLRRSA